MLTISEYLEKLLWLIFQKRNSLNKANKRTGKESTLDKA